MKRTPINAPIDEVHAQSIQATKEIRGEFEAARRRLGLAPTKESKS